MLIKTFGGAIFGINAIIVTVEVNIDAGAAFFMVGLPDSAVKESHQRIEAAFRNNGFKVPGKKIVINLAPADIRKEGSCYDLTIALAILAASEQIHAPDLEKFIVMGELSLDGTLLPIRGALPIAIQARTEGYKGLILPRQNAHEAAVVGKLEVYGAETLKEVIQFFSGEKKLERFLVNTREEFFSQLNNYEYDFSDVKGQETYILIACNKILYNFFMFFLLNICTTF